MEQGEIETWLTKARQTTVNHLGFTHDWWPTTNKNGQARASAWSLGFFLHAALSRCVGAELLAACSAGASKEMNEKMVQALWTNSPSRKHQSSQVVLDFSVHNPESSSPVQLTGESETYPTHGVGQSLTTADGYAWDFYKLLLVPSTSRVYFARVGANGGQSGGERCRALAASLASLVDWYGPVMLRPHDELGGVILPAAKKNHDETVIFWLDRGKLRSAPITTPLL